MIKTLFTCICLFFVTISCVHANQQIRIVRGQDFFPYHFIGENGRETGFIIDIIEAVARPLNLEVKFEQYSWTRCLKMVEKGQADAMMNLFKTQDRLRYMFFCENILSHETNRFFKLKSLTVDFSGNFSTIADRKIGAVYNYSYGPDFDGFSFPNIYRLETEEDLIRSLIHRRCDIIIGNDLAMKALIRQKGFQDKIGPIPATVSRAPLYLGFSKARGHKELCIRFSNSLKTFKDSKAYADILISYGI